MDIVREVTLKVNYFTSRTGLVPTQLYLGYSEWTELLSSTVYLRDRSGKVTYGHTEFLGLKVFRVVALSHLAVA